MTSIANNESLAPVRVKLNNMLGTVQNVMDYGATGNGVTDDRAAIQAAIDWTTAPERGIIFFPPGNYKIGGTLYLDNPGHTTQTYMTLMGACAGRGEALSGHPEQAGGARIWGDFAGPLIQCGFLGDTGDQSNPNVIERLGLYNAHAAGIAIDLRRRLLTQIRDCWIKAHIGIILDNLNAPCSVVNCCIRGFGHADTNGIGVYLGGCGSTVQFCDIVGFYHGVRMSLNANCVRSCRIEVCGDGIVVGQRYYPDHAKWQASGFVISGCSFESSQRSQIHVWNGSSGVIEACAITANVAQGASGGGGIVGECYRGLWLDGANGLVVQGTSVTGQFSTAAIDFNGSFNCIMLATTYHNGGHGALLLGSPSFAQSFYAN